MSQYVVEIEGDTDPVFPRLAYDDFLSAVERVAVVLESWDGATGSPRVRIVGDCDPGFWTLNGIRQFREWIEKSGGSAEEFRKLSRTPRT